MYVVCMDRSEKQLPQNGGLIRAAPIFHGLCCAALLKTCDNYVLKNISILRVC